MVAPLKSRQPSYIALKPSEVPDVEEDRAVEGPIPRSVGPLGLSEIIYGGGVLQNGYNTDEHLQSDTPLRTLRLALRYGIRAIDTSAYYGPSEIVLGALLKELSGEFPRNSYKLMTKCGRFGDYQKDFDYSPASIRACVLRSLARLHTSYLDVVLLHDVEFVCNPVQPEDPEGDTTAALDVSKQSQWGLDEDAAAHIHGAGDQKVLVAYAELQKMKDEGLVKAIGLSGYPLPTILRLAVLIAHTPQVNPLDVVLSYSHSSLQNITIRNFIFPLQTRGKVTQVIAASPFSMGLLTPKPPSWHPAPKPLLDASLKAAEFCEQSKWPGGLPSLAAAFGMQQTAELPVVAGLSNTAEVHEAIRMWRAINGPADQSDDNFLERFREQVKGVRDIFESAGYLDWSWRSPQPMYLNTE